MKKFLLLIIMFGCCSLSGCVNSTKVYEESSEDYQVLYEDCDESPDFFEERVVRMFAGIKDSLDLSGEPIGCYISDDSTFALILEKFYEDKTGEYGKAHVYSTEGPICSSSPESYCGRLTYQGAGSYAYFLMASCYLTDEVILLQGGHGGNIYELEYRTASSCDNEIAHTLYSIGFHELLEVCSK